MTPEQYIATLGVLTVFAVVVAALWFVAEIYVLGGKKYGSKARLTSSLGVLLMTVSVMMHENISVPEGRNHESMWLLLYFGIAIFGFGIVWSFLKWGFFSEPEEKPEH